MDEKDYKEFMEYQEFKKRKAGKIEDDLKVPLPPKKKGKIENLLGRVPGPETIINAVSKPSKKYDNKEFLPKKTAALEILSHMNQLRILSGVNIGLTFGILALGLLYDKLDLLVAVGSIGLNVWFFKKAQDEIQRLRLKYRV